MRLDLGPSLEALRAQALAEIDVQAEAARLRHITPGAGQALTYERKRAEAEALVRDPAPAPRDYPFLGAEVGITGDTLAGVAALVHQRSAEWTRHAGAIEAARLGAKRRIQDAANPRALRAAALVKWPD
jgi:hypothetical protein